MTEQERRYRSGSEHAESTGVDYKRTAEKRAAHDKHKKMTYEDFLESVHDTDKLIEIDTDSRWEEFLDFMEEYFNWIHTKRVKYQPIAKKKIKQGVKSAYRKQPINKVLMRKWAKLARSRLKPLEARFGTKNVMFSLMSGIAVLVLSGGFLLFRGGNEGGKVESATDQNFTIFGDNNGETQVQPDFEPIITDTASDEQGLYFDPTVGVAVFRDLIRGSSVTVSQQPLTEEQKMDPQGQLELIATQLFAGISFESTNLGTVYLTTPGVSEDPSQVALFMTDELLVFVRTVGTVIATEGWVEYVSRIII